MTESTVFTRRERQVLRILLENGAGNIEIGSTLGISPETVKIYMTRIMNKTGFSSRTELAVNLLHKKYGPK